MNIKLSTPCPANHICQASDTANTFEEKLRAYNADTVTLTISKFDNVNKVVKFSEFIPLIEEFNSFVDGNPCYHGVKLDPGPGVKYDFSGCLFETLEGFKLPKSGFNPFAIRLVDCYTLKTLVDIPDDAISGLSLIMDDTNGSPSDAGSFMTSLELLPRCAELPSTQAPVTRSPWGMTTWLRLGIPAATFSSFEGLEDSGYAEIVISNCGHLTSFKGLPKKVRRLSLNGDNISSVDDFGPSTYIDELDVSKNVMNLNYTMGLHDLLHETKQIKKIVFAWTGLSIDDQQMLTNLFNDIADPFEFQQRYIDSGLQDYYANTSN
jgi:hypothetical protein